MNKIISIVIPMILIISSLGTIALSKENSSKLISIEECDMVIIAPNKFSDELQPLIDHKNTVGIQTFLKTTEEIYSEYMGIDNAEKIKYFIKDSIEMKEVKYVLLMGGHKGQLFQWHIPARIVHLDDGARYTEFVSDLYYADIYKENGNFDNWNSNGDNVIAKWGEDTFDLIPDICVGRLPCRNRKEVKTIVNKIIEYETGSFDPSWFNQFLIVGGDTVPNNGGSSLFEGEFLCEAAATIMNDFNAIKLFTSDLSLFDHVDFIDKWNKGCGFALYSGRAGPSSFLTFDMYGNQITPFHVNYLDQLVNKGKYPIFIINGCLSGKFDVTILNFIKRILIKPNIEWSDIAWDCIGYSFVKQQSSGAIATIAPTSQCWVGLGDIDNNNIPDMIETVSGFLTLEFLRVYAEESIDILGELHSTAIEQYVHKFPVHSNKIDCKTIQEYGLIGDPSLKIGGYL
jgi:hypothetical protein